MKILIAVIKIQPAKTSARNPTDGLSSFEDMKRPCVKILHNLELIGADEIGSSAALENTEQTQE